MATRITAVYRLRRVPPGPAHSLAVLAVALLFLAGCAGITQTVQQINVLETPAEKARILLMTPDVKYYLLTAGGLTEPQPDWTAAARLNFVAAVDAYAEQRGADLVTMNPDEPLDPLETQYDRLHNAVGSTILANYFGVKLPSKGDRFDWTLGPGVRAIGEKYGADYALFSLYRDFEASGGRVAFAMIAALFGLGMSTGGQGGFASLVDLQSGDVVWFNVLQAGTGDLRSPDGARAVIAQLFKDLPGR